MKTRLYDEFVLACQMEGIAPSAWAKAHGLGTSIPTSLKNDIKPETSTLKQLYSGWHNKSIGQNLLLAYLKDEIERVGSSLKEIEPILKSSTQPDQTEKDLEIIARFMARKEPLRESLHQLAKLLELSEWATPSERAKAQIEADAAAMRAMAGKRYAVHSKRRRASSS